jgi:hypothetical protein
MTQEPKGEWINITNEFRMLVAAIREMDEAGILAAKDELRRLIGDG